MEKQHCKVGAIHRLDTDTQGPHILEHLLLNFQRKAMEANQNGSRLQEFFEQKARKIQQLLQQL